MPSIGRFLDLLEAVSRRDWANIEQIAKAAAEDERKKKHFNAAHKISEAIEVAISRSGIEDSIGTVSSPISPITSLPPELLHEENCSDIPDLILREKLKVQLDEVFGEWRHESKLREKGLSPRKTILLHGPPGCGKTHLAKYIAKTLNMRLFVVRFDSLISSFLGETGANIRKVFDFLSSNRCALLIDELDAIGKLRDDKNELGELKRVVISLLQNMDITNSRSIIIAATNHPHMLDPAIWRRFEVIFEMEFPSDEERINLFKKYLGCNIPSENINLLIDCSNGMTGADIVQVCNSAKRRSLIEDSGNIFCYLFVAIMDHLKRHPIKDNSKKIDERKVDAAISLKQICDNKYSFKELEEISGIPHSTLHNRYANRFAS